MANDVNNVSAGKPKIGGAIFRAPIGVPLPTTADEALDDGFKNLGYCGDSGVSNTNSPSTKGIKAWGGDTVLVIQEDKSDTFKFTLLEVLNSDVLKTVYGSSNVNGTLESGLSIIANAKEAEAGSWVIDMILNSNTIKRLVIPNGKISDLADITYSDAEALGYEVTLSALPDESGNSHYEYLKANE